MSKDNKEKTVLTKGEKRSIFRWFLNGGASLNYERMMGLAYTYSMLPVLKEIYEGDAAGLKKSVLSHLQYYNCSPYLNPYVMGVNIGVERAQKSDSLDTVRSLKTGLMGPLSGLGDSVFVVIPWTIFGAIAANMALNGSAAGIFIWILVTWLLKALGYPLFKAGIVSGTNLVNSLETKLKVLKECVAILGLMVVGALISTVVKANIGLTFTQGDLTMTGNEILAQIMPGLIPAAVVAAVFWMLGKKVKPVYIILLIIVLSIVLNALGILV